MSDLDRLLKGSVNEATEGHSTGPFDIGYWRNVFAFVVRPLVKTLRDVRRYVDAIPPALIRLDDEVNLVDVLALRACLTRTARGSAGHRSTPPRRWRW